MHKWTHRRSFLATLFFPVLSIYVLPVSAGAQCADGSLPPCRSASPPAAPASPSTVPANKCSIIVSVQKDGQPVPGVAVALSNSNFGGGTNEVGNYQFSGLICKRNYRITLSNPNLDFTPSSKVVGALKGTKTVNFTAVNRVASSRPAPKNAPSSAPCPAPPNPLEIEFGKPRTDQVNGWCAKYGPKQYFVEYSLKAAVGGEIVRFDLQGSSTPNLYLNVRDKNGLGCPVVATHAPPGPSYYEVVLPGAGDYLVRVVNSLNEVAECQLTALRVGLTDEGYSGQLKRVFDIVKDPSDSTFFGSLDDNVARSLSGDEAAGERLKRVTAILETLREIQPNRPEAHSLLSLCYLYHQKNLAAATEAAEQALKLNGEVRFRVIFGDQIDKKEQRILNNKYFCWLVIKNGEAYCEDLVKTATSKIFMTEPESLRKIRPNLPGVDFGLKIYGVGIKAKRKMEYVPDDYEFIPLSSQAGDQQFLRAETVMIKDFIKRYLQGDR